jgi:hypothetical protein
VITIGIDPHKSSLTAVAVEPSGQTRPPIRLVVDKNTPAALLAWATQWPDRQWAVEGATGLGRGIAQQLVTLARPSSTCRPSWPLERDS